MIASPTVDDTRSDALVHRETWRPCLLVASTTAIALVGRIWPVLLLFFILILCENTIPRESDKTIIEAIQDERHGARRMVLSELGLLLPAVFFAVVGFWLMRSGEDAPGRISVYEGPKEIARIRKKLTMRENKYAITCLDDTEHQFAIRDDAVYLDGRLVGRIYFLRDQRYLDIQDEAFHHAVLGFFVTMS